MAVAREMIAALIGPLVELAGGALKNRAAKGQAEAQLKLTEAEARAKILLSKNTSVADYERIMAEGSQSSLRDEWFSGVLSIPLILCFIPGAEGVVEHGFEQLSKAPEWYFYCLGTAILSSFGVRAGGKYFGGKK